MKRFLVIFLAFVSTNVFAGNPDRIGENGAYQLLINGWPRSTGFWDMYTARITGVESMRLNPAGLAHVKKMEVALAQTLWFQGSQTQVTQVGFAGKLGADNVIGIEMMSLNVGDLYKTTVNNPDPNNGLGTFRPRFLNLGLTFSRTFSNRIYGGATIRLITESVENVKATGFAIDAGLQYILGKKENLRFGVSIRNLGTPMKYTGDGLTYRGVPQDGDDYQGTRSEVTNKFELPAQLTIGASYDLWLGPDYKCYGAYNLHRVTMTAQFTSNTYGKDHFGGGVEYAFKEMFMARVGYRHEPGMFNPDTRLTAYTGLSGGVSVEVPFKENGPSLGIDYSYRTSNPFGGTHSIGLRFGLGGEDPCAEEKVGDEALSSEKKKKGKPIKLSKAEVEKIQNIAASINFETGSAELTNESKATLDDLADFLNEKPTAFLNIAAHTDDVGNDDDNLQLSRERALAVKTYLLEKGIESDRMKAKGFGETMPVASNETEEGKAQNRRVELTVN
jgi:outer membrane protein OmpA-like peptidoglycan-associated protein